MTRWVIPSLLILLLCCGCVLALAQNAEASELVMQAARAMFVFLTTPFILEATVASAGLITVLTLNEYRRKKDAVDEWVIMPKEEKPQEAERK
jgi:hypothetical protein